MNTNAKLKRNSTKGATIRQAGFETSIHALPSEVKQQVDLMINQKCPPTKIWRYLSQKYPNLHLPSKSAIYNYRKKYFTDSLVNLRQVSQIETGLDIDKVKLKSVLLTQIKRFIAIDIPSLREGWLEANEKDSSGKISKDTRELGRLYMDAVKIGLEAIPKLNIPIDVHEKEISEAEEESVYDWKEVFERNIENRWYQILVRHGYSITKTNNVSDPDHASIGKELASLT